MEEQESSSGLMIGIIIGGAVIVLLVLVGIFGAGFWFLMDSGGAAPKPAAVMVAEEKMAAVPMFKIGNPRERLLGAWQATTKDGGRQTIEFRDDGTYQLLVKRPEAADVEKAPGRWQLKLEEGGPAPRLVRFPEAGGIMTDDIRFLDDDRFVREGWDGSPYERQRQEKP